MQREHYEVAKASSDYRFLVNRQHWDHPSLRYRLIDGDMQLLPGLDLIKTSGHCPGHQSVLVRLPETGPVLPPGDAGAAAKPVARCQFWFSAHRGPGIWLEREPPGCSSRGFHGWPADAGRSCVLPAFPFELPYLGDDPII